MSDGTFTERIGGGPNIRRAAYGFAVGLGLVLVGFGVVALDDAERVFAVLGGLLSIGTGGLALPFVGQAPDAVREKSPAAAQIDTVTKAVGGLNPKLDDILRRLDAVERLRSDFAARLDRGPVVAEDPTLAERRRQEEAIRSGAV